MKEMFDTIPEKPSKPLVPDLWLAGGGGGPSEPQHLLSLAGLHGLQDGGAAAHRRGQEVVRGALEDLLVPEDVGGSRGAV